jgi:hypothetical protein
MGANAPTVWAAVHRVQRLLLAELLIPVGMSSSCSSAHHIVLVLVVPTSLTGRAATKPAKSYVGQAVLVVDTAYFFPTFSNSDGLNVREDSSVRDIGPAKMAWSGVENVDNRWP